MIRIRIRSSPPSSNDEIVKGDGWAIVKKCRSNDDS